MVRLWCWSVLELQASSRLGLGLLLVAHDENPQARSPGAMADTGATWVWENRLASADASDQSYPKLRCTTVTCEKGAGRSRRPIRTVKSRLIGLRLLRCARVRCSIPHAASLGAVGRGLCGFYILGESWTCEGKCQSHGKYRNKSFHNVFSLTLVLKSRASTERAFTS